MRQSGRTTKQIKHLIDVLVNGERDAAYYLGWSGTNDYAMGIACRILGEMGIEHTIVKHNREITLAGTKKKIIFVSVESGNNRLEGCRAHLVVDHSAWDGLPGDRKEWIKYGCPMKFDPYGLDETP